MAGNPAASKGEVPMDKKAKPRRASGAGAQTVKRSGHRPTKQRSRSSIGTARAAPVTTAQNITSAFAESGRTFEQVPVGIAHFGLDGRYLQANPALCTLLGYSEKELLSRTVLDVTMPEDRAEGEALQRNLIAGEIKAFSREKRYRCKNGTVRWCSVAVQLVRGPGGAPRYFVSVIDDI